MGRWFARLLVFGIVLCLCTSAWAGKVSDKLTPEEIEKIKGGEVILKNDLSESNKSGSGIAYAAYPCTLDDFWKVVLDYEHYKEIFPRIVSVKKFNEEGNRFLTEFKIDVSIKKLTYTSYNVISEDRLRLDFGLDDAYPHKYQKKMGGYWQLEQLGEKMIIAEYKVDVELDIPVIGGLINKIVRSLAGDDLPDVMNSVRKRIESGGTWNRLTDK
jgi:coenzyme Q-binding protein COQ10